MFGGQTFGVIVVRETRTVGLLPCLSSRFMLDYIKPAENLNHG
jgi:hypothetical protein